ncbi:hypothetical protein ACFRFH_09240 [Leifsonia sp. NPDC056824]|uniref:hypothetical protein n=1 Tax=Leifsonia sp. NPDC056824 TaxID=3345953 RepID=UPI0036B2962C
MTSEPASASRTTLTWGGAGLILATVVPIVAELAFLFPPPGTSWLYSAETPAAGTASAVVLVITFVVLAFGIRGERGIAGPSRAGRGALVLFALTSVVSAGYVGMNLTVVAVSSGALAVMSILSWALQIARVVALIVAAILVFRAGVVTGAARWALPIVAFVLVAVKVVSRVPFPAVVDVWLWGLAAIPLGLLLTGVLFLVQGLRSPRTIETPTVPAA